MLAVWSRVRVAGRTPLIVDLGCGDTAQYPGSFGIDRCPAAAGSVRAGSDRRWYPLHAGCDGATVFADLAPLADGSPGADEAHLARFFE